MPKIIDPDDLVRDTSVTFVIGDPDARFVQLTSSLVNASSNIPPLTSGSDSGVTLQALYSFCKEEWKSQEDLIKIPFPLISITKEQFDWTNNWDLQDDESRYLVRDAGWSVISGSVTTQEWVGIVTLGTLGSTDQVYYQQHPDSSSVNFQMSGTINQAIKHFSQSHVQEEFNARDFTKLFVREYKKIYDDASIQTDLGVDTQEYIRYAIPLQNSTDLKIETDLEGQATGSPYNEVTIDYLTGSYFQDLVSGSSVLPSGSPVVHSTIDDRWFISDITASYTATDSDPALDSGSWITWSQANGGGERLVGSNYFAYNIIIDAGAGQNNTAEQVYTRIQYELRLDSDIDDGTQDPDTHIGKISDLLL